MTAGRPPKYKTPEKMQKAIDKYFEDCPDTTTIHVGGEVGMIEIPCPTITGLALYLGFCDRHSMYAYEVKPKFSNTIKNARARMVQIYEADVRYGKNAAGAIFMLKNFGYSDRQEIQHTGDTDKPVAIEDVTDVKKAAEIYKQALKSKK